MRGKDTKTTGEGEGVVHIAIEDLFKLLNSRAVQVGRCLCICVLFLVIWTECFIIIIIIIEGFRV